MKVRHQWNIKNISKTGEKATCIKCGLIKECFGYVGGFHYYYKKDDFYFYETNSCGENMIVEMITAKLYTNDSQLFDTKTFYNWDDFIFWADQFRLVTKKRKQKGLKYVKKIIVNKTNYEKRY